MYKYVLRKRNKLQKKKHIKNILDVLTQKLYLYPLKFYPRRNLAIKCSKI
jgi:hypothetical protein